MLLYERYQITQDNINIINCFNDRFEIDCIFNKKGKYKIEIFGNSEKGKEIKYILEYEVNVENDAKEQLSFPKFYKGKEEISVCLLVDWLLLCGNERI